MAFLLQSPVKDYIWGGDALKLRWGKHADGNIAESWEFSLYKGMESVAVNGPYAGMNLSEIREKAPEVFGEKVKEFPLFPLLIKLIDAKNDLSIQVHPTDFYALTHAAELGKTEMWYIAEATPDAAIYFGFERETTREEVEKRIKEGTICEILKRIPVKCGDCFFVKAGTVHAILAGVTVFEVQESSNLTYRLYDYNRRDASGNLRELHVEKALEVMKLSPATAQNYDDRQDFPGYSVRKLSSCNYFTVSEYRVTECVTLGQNGCFGTFTVLDGSAKIGDLSLKKGDTVLIPAGEFETVSGNCALLYTTI